MINRSAAATMLAAGVLSVSALAVGADSGYRIRVVASGLSRPTGIAVGDWQTLYFTEVPTPGIAGGQNGVSSLDLETGTVTVLHRGEPEPINLAVSRDNDVYWTCRTAGVILKMTEEGDTTPVLTGLQQPTGISIGRRGTIFFTEVPMPGVAGGTNGVSSYDGVAKTMLSVGEPEPVDVVVSRDGTVYWTCRTAGVILQRRGGQTSLVIDGLDSPTGIALDRKGDALYFTEVPTPGVAGTDGGRNRVSVLNLKSRRVRVINHGDPEPTDIAVAPNGRVYWTCTSAGVIVEARPRHGRG